MRRKTLLRIFVILNCVCDAQKRTQEEFLAPLRYLSLCGAPTNNSFVSYIQLFVNKSIVIYIRCDCLNRPVVTFDRKVQRFVCNLSKSVYFRRSQGNHPPQLCIEYRLHSGFFPSPIRTHSFSLPFIPHRNRFAGES